MTPSHDTVYIQQFNSFGFVAKKLVPEVFAQVKERVAEVQNNFDNATPFNKDLAGNIEREYKLPGNLDFLSGEIQELVTAHESRFNYVNSLQLTKEPLPMTIGNTWVNFQKKHEFNPLHNHTGVFSFVIWVDIPFFAEEEKKAQGSKNSNFACAGSFVFYYLSSHGRIMAFEVPADKTHNGTMMLFPAEMQHAVYPFYTSDEYRISVAGNLVFDIGR